MLGVGVAHGKSLQHLITALLHGARLQIRTQPQLRRVAQRLNHGQILVEDVLLGHIAHGGAKAVEVLM